ncbi:MAG: protein kinase [Deltaproteobacteria bacterium]|nr:protein kinase [Deltaproteobacteria bacterium]
MAKKSSGLFRRLFGGKRREEPEKVASPRAVVVADLFEEGKEVADLLRRLGLEAELCIGGEQAMSKLQDKPPDLLYLDCWESRLNGVSLLQVVSHYHSDLPSRVIARAPGGAAAGIGSQLVAMGVRTVLPKKVTPNDLAEKVAEITGQSIDRELLAQANDEIKRERVAAPGDELAAGTWIDARYEVIKYLGRGACATVHEVSDSYHNDKHLALKWLSSDAPAHDAADRLMAEYTIGNLITHENVIRAYDVGSCLGRPYVTLEILEGTSLDEHLEAYGSPPPELALPLLSSAAAGLGAVHAQGIVHRDIKPGNLFLDESSGDLKLIDFGIALLPHAPEYRRRTHAVLGTPAYVSPEQLRGETAGVQASDVFSLGVVFYEVLAGRRPFRAGTVQQLLSRIANNPPVAPRKLNPTVPRSLSDLVLHMLSKRPEQRPPTGNAVLEQLRSEKLLAELAKGQG